MTRYTRYVYQCMFFMNGTKVSQNNILCNVFDNSKR